MDNESPRRILVIGDEMIDVYIHGTLQDSQDGCQKFVESSRTLVNGGAANAMNCLTYWKAHTRLLFDCGMANIPIKTRYVQDGRYVFRHDNEPPVNDDRETICKGGVHKFRELFVANDILRYMSIRGDQKPHAVLISDYDKGMVSLDFIREVIDTCLKYDIPVIADPKRPVYHYKGAIIKCNEEYADKYLKSWSGENMVVTRGAKGPYWLGGIYPGGHSVKCINHVGAGDCFAAHLTLALAYGLSFKDAVAIAHSAGRVYVQRPHNQPPRPEEVLAVLIAL